MGSHARQMGSGRILLRPLGQGQIRNRRPPVRDRRIRDIISDGWWHWLRHFAPREAPVLESSLDSGAIPLFRCPGRHLALLPGGVPVMVKRPGRASGQFVFHVLNRAIENTTLFVDPSDYTWFLTLLEQAARAYNVRVLAYCVMPNHWHLVLWPTTDDGLSAFMHWLTGSHAQSWRWQRGSQGRGAVYQGTFKAIAVQTDGHFLRLCRYVERNPVRARLVEFAQDWAWSSASPQAGLPGRPGLSEWPVGKPATWTDYINEPILDGSLREIRKAIRRNEHYGDKSWKEAVCRELGWRSGRGPGRPCGHGTIPALTIP
jgi:putative transposase